jgi:hypothetical protein|mmetsp:Transcript_7497/g.13501  ORF Transcript_7497/g.13501 Transcript_7497/m.13501 type:complete len:89 (+) Transcript_7497:266-532(+)
MEKDLLWTAVVKYSNELEGQVCDMPLPNEFKCLPSLGTKNTSSKVVGGSLKDRFLAATKRYRMRVRTNNCTITRIIGSAYLEVEEQSR